MKTCLVTGGFGCLGRALVQLLSERGVQIRVLDIAPTEEFAQLPNVEILKGDILDAASVERAVQGVDTIFHCASVLNLHYFWASITRKVTVDGTKNLLDAALKAGVKRFIFTSTHNVVFNRTPIEMGDESLPFTSSYIDTYTEAKQIAERLVLDYNGKDGLYTCCIRPGGIWGAKDQMTLKAFIKSKSIPLVNRVAVNYDWSLDMSFNYNLAHCHILAALKLEEEQRTQKSGPVNGSVYFCGEPLKVFEVMDQVAKKAFDAPCYSIKLPRVFCWMLYYLSWLLEFLHMLVGWYIDLKAYSSFWFTPIEMCKIMNDHTFSCAKACKELGYRPLYTLEQQIDLTAQWVREERERNEIAKMEWQRIPVPRPSPGPWWLLILIIIGMSLVTVMAISPEARALGPQIRPYATAPITYLMTTPHIIIPIAVIAWGLHCIEALFSLVWLWKGRVGFSMHGFQYVLYAVTWFVLCIMFGGAALVPLIKQSRALEQRYRASAAKKA